MVHSLVSTGRFEIHHTMNQDTDVALQKRHGSLKELHGMLGFIDSIQVYNRTKTTDGPKLGLSSEEKVYKQFLIYSNCYAAELPVIICEGETDNVYLTHAIRSLAAEFPNLAAVKNRKIGLKVRLFRYPHSSTARILGLGDGGSGARKNFIATYGGQTKRFTAPGLENPVILLYDNDSGANDIKAVIRKASKGKTTEGAPFVHIFKNIYAMATPIVGTAPESKIEDFFDEAPLGVLVGGKTFHTGKDFDIEKHYGKVVFARRVVEPKADTINFAGFRPLLTNLAGAIQSYKAVITSKGAGA